MNRIMLVEDDKYLGDALKRYLNKNDFLCDWIEDDRDVMIILNSKHYDLIVLDLILKFSKGEELLAKIRKKYSIPVIVLTAKVGIESKEDCFNLGADDYITKPFEPRELILRINSILRRVYSNRYIIGDVCIDLDNKIAKKNSEVVGFTQKEWSMLELFVKNKGKVVSVDEILRYVWDGSDVGEDSIRAYVKRLRNVLGKDRIKNIKGRGYILLEG
ncbi:response regulator transcription factor [Hippea alviniae]|uniref:response regulator transcription factor n=1 Tax=Hippea alviniae TaxID=1279027 RepID=UPI0003B342C0|nr:response regulator transcription factor [Hippea alviniae]